MSRRAVVDAAWWTAAKARGSYGEHAEAVLGLLHTIRTLTRAEVDLILRDVDPYQVAADVESAGSEEEYQAGEDAVLDASTKALELVLGWPQESELTVIARTMALLVVAPRPATGYYVEAWNSCLVPADLDDIQVRIWLDARQAGHSAADARMVADAITAPAAG